MKRPAMTTCALLIGLSLCGNGHGSTPRGRVDAIACAPSNPKMAAVLVDSAVWITEDQGENWSRTALLPPDSAEAIGALSTRGPDELPNELTISRPSLNYADESEEIRTKIDATLEGPGPKTDDGISGDRESNGEPSTMAVGDGGRWAVSRSDRLYLGGPGPGVSMDLALPGLQGVIIDHGNRIWAVTKNEILLFEQNSQTQRVAHRIPISGGRPPVRGAPGTSLLVPTSLGLWIVNGGQSDERPTGSLHRIGPIDAVAGAPDGRRYFVASRGRLGQWAPGLSVDDLKAVPAHTTSLLAGRGEPIRFFANAGRWLTGTGYGWQPVPARSVAIDARGRVWLGGDSGPIGPGKKVRNRPTRTTASTTFASVLQGAMEQLETTVGPPPCPTPLRNLLPTARFSAGFGQRAWKRGMLPEQELQARMHSWFYVGINLSWTLQVTLPDACHPQRKTWQALRGRRTQTLRALWTAWQLTCAFVAEDPVKRIANRIERERLAQLIRLQSGVLPTIKEQR